MGTATYTTDLIEQERKFFKIGANSRIVISFFKTISDKVNQKKIDIRLWYCRDADNNLWIPTRKGVAMHVSDVKDNLLPILTELCNRDT